MRPDFLEKGDRQLHPDEAEALMRALRQAEVDAVISEHAVLLLRPSEVQSRQRAGIEPLHPVLESARIGTWDWDVRSGAMTWPPQTEALYGLAPGTFAGTYKAYLGCVHPADRENTRQAEAQALQQGSDYDLEFRALWPGETVRWLSAKGHVTTDAAGNPARVQGVVMDVTRWRQAEETLKVSLREKELLLKEIHHRIKNNLQVVASLLTLQTTYAPHPQLEQALAESQRRIRAMAFFHEQLYQSTTLTRIDLTAYLRTLASELYRAYGGESRRITLMLELEDVWLSPWAAVPCGLILTELLSNSLRHAFADDRGGTIHVELRSDATQQVTLRIRDTGIGMPATMTFPNPNATSLGLELVSLLTDQLQGAITLEATQGTTFTLRFRDPRPPNP